MIVLQIKAKLYIVSSLHITQPNKRLPTEMMKHSVKVLTGTTEVEQGNRVLFVIWLLPAYIIMNSACCTM